MIEVFPVPASPTTIILITSLSWAMALAEIYLDGGLWLADWIKMVKQTQKLIVQEQEQS